MAEAADSVPSVSDRGIARHRATGVVAALAAPLLAACSLAACTPAPGAEAPTTDQRESERGAADAAPSAERIATDAAPAASATSSAAAAASGAADPVATAGRAPSAEPAASASAAPSALATAPAACPTIDAPPGYESCEAAELTGEGPCEAICVRPRKTSAQSRCCEAPVEIVILSGKKPLLRLNACSFVPPSCAHVHGHGNMDAQLRVLSGMPPDVVFVEGGCEARAMAHGYVPPGVAAWSGCRHQRYRWDGKRFARARGPASEAP